LPGPTIIAVDLNLIDDDPKNPRGTDVGDVAGLKISIAHDGLQNPLQVIELPGGRFRLFEGHRRRKALEELGAAKAPALIRRFDSELDRVVSQGAMHTHAVDWDPMAWARFLYRLFDEFNLNRNDIAHRLGKSPVWVRDTMSFVHLTPTEQRALADRRMSRRDALRRLANRRAIRDGNPAPAVTVPKQRARKITEPHLNLAHRLAEQVAARCASGGLQHAARPKIGGVGCGVCWEQVIAADAITDATRPALARVA
jgi:ParB/RepB/Spo0J family partition protein